jgi:hypothetical protein
MGRIAAIYGRKLFSLALIFNSLLTIVFAIGLLAGYYTLYPEWTPYPPYILDGRLFWILIPATIMNIFPCVNIGQVHTGRVWFHHYVYGIIVAATSATLTLLWAPNSNLNLLTLYTTDIGINIGRFFILGGATLVIDDLPDISKRLKNGLSLLKSKATKNGRTLNTLQTLMGAIQLYFLLAISIYLSQHQVEITLANSVLVTTLVITTITAFANARRKGWLQMDTKQTEDKTSLLTR